jgi:hypothetical protein
MVRLGFPWAAPANRNLSIINSIPRHTMNKKTYYIGLDVHKESVAIGYVNIPSRDKATGNGVRKWGQKWGQA